MKIEINVIPKGQIHGLDFGYFGLLALFGIFPLGISTGGIIYFGVYDERRNKKLNSYRYSIEHRLYHHGLLIPPLGVIFPIFSERFDQSQNLKTYAIARVVFNEFEEDFIKDFYLDDTLRKAAYLNNPPIHKIQNPTKEEIAKNPYLPYLITRLESKLIQRGIEILKQDDSPDSPLSVKADRVIKVDSLNILKDSISVHVSCSDIKNNTEVWTEKIGLPAGVDNTESILDRTVDKLIENLVSKREIN